MGARNDYTIKTVQDVFGGYGGGSTSGSSDEFYMDTGRVSDISQEIKSAAQEYADLISDLNSKIDQLQNAILGSVYESFVQGYSQYKSRLNTVNEVLQTFSAILDNKVSNTSQVATRVANILEGGN